jgi:hypothetical protein
VSAEVTTTKALQAIFDEATDLHLAHQLTESNFKPLLERALAITGYDGETLHPLLAYAPRAWYDDYFPR